MSPSRITRISVVRPQGLGPLGESLGNLYNLAAPLPGRQHVDQERPDLKNLSLEGLEELLKAMGEPRYRADQIAAWVFPRGVTSFEAMTDLSKDLRHRLGEQARITGSEIVRSERSQLDGTEKLLLAYEDGARVEAVLLRDSDRTTGCISTQVGCRLGCTFCATGAMGFERDLTAAEIIEQIQALRRSAEPDRLDNVVFMGMGEPLDNYDATLRAVRTANAPWGLGIGARRMTISTAGLVPGIRRLADEGLQVNLALSLNAPDQELRAKLMPIAERYPLPELIGALKEYVRKVGRLITLEYVLLGGINDTQACADGLADLAGGLLCKVNLICYNEIENVPFSPPDDQTQEMFYARLRRRCPTVVRRISRGSDIAAGCGQLRIRKTD
ncbi:MAG: 23S rRNA (adenine(2503)-C(2))-methyltransferase RlmN [Candidatus Eisenbacteria bacterium]|nr:23S rRNA (adenine(2503)-C(2))-methyltransferase RlmN [Candidatus Eisenbacteria bacterium]